ncbi:sensor histidine kinase [Niabella sp. CJ426]|uniref:sensor histidine kinase n=1 Tax=Niabella sp. CJ426 TaxID=3393740 RepID=UPI003CFF98BC
MYTLKNPLFFTAVLTAVSIGVILVSLGLIVFRAQRRYFLKRQQVCSRELETLKLERLRMARDLHDELAPTLQLVYRQLNVIAFNKSDFQQVALSARDMLEISIRRIGEISKNLEDHRILKAGLQQSIQQFISQHSMAVQLYFQFRYQLAREPAPLVAVTLYCILLELVNNTIKHAQATIAFITLRQQHKTLYFFYADNGNGFNLQQMQEAEGSGISNLQHRVSQMGGRLEVQVGEGASFLISIPLF